MSSEDRLWKIGLFTEKKVGKKSRQKIESV